jgi:hypothetical protein
MYAAGLGTESLQFSIMDAVEGSRNLVNVLKQAQTMSGHVIWWLLPLVPLLPSIIGDIAQYLCVCTCNSTAGRTSGCLLAQ